MNTEILIVDDATFMRRIIKEALVQGGFQNTLEAKDGVEALQIVESKKPHVMLLDITMPGMSGLQVLEKTLELAPATKVIMCSAVGQESTIEKAIRMGAVDFIVKPFQPAKLVEVIQQSL